LVSARKRNTKSYSIAVSQERGGASKQAKAQEKRSTSDSRMDIKKRKKGTKKKDVQNPRNGNELPGRHID
jgi:hypothetical protein